MSHMLNAESILEYLDKAAQKDQIPMMDNINYPFISGQLQVYRNESAWAIVFQSLTLRSEAEIILAVDPVGPLVKVLRWQDYLDGIPSQFMKNFEELNALQSRYEADKSGQASEDDLFIPLVLTDLDDDGVIQTISVRDQPVSAAELETLKSIYDPDDYLSAYRMYEALIEKHKESMLATKAEITRFFPSGLPPLFLSLDQWRHPDLASDEKPSQCETFIQLARAMQSGRIEDYALKEKPNTDWRQWLEE